MENFNANVKIFAKRFYRFFGLYPVVIDRSGASKFPEFLLQCWSFVLLLSAAVSVVCVVVNEEKFLNEKSIEKANDLLKFGCLMASACVMIIDSLINRPRFKKISTIIGSFEKACQPLRVNFDEYRRDMIRKFAGKFMFVITLLVIIEFYILFNNTWIEFYFANIFWSCAARFRHLQYLEMLHVIRSKIAILNNAMTKLVENSKSSRSRINYQALLEDLQSVKTSYGVLWSLTFEVNEAFCWSLASNLIQNFVQIGCDSYSFYISLVHAKSENETFHFLQFASLVVLPTVLIVLILDQANKIKVESTLIPIKLHSIRKTKDDGDLYKMVTLLKADLKAGLSFINVRRSFTFRYKPFTKKYQCELKVFFLLTIDCLFQF